MPTTSTQWVKWSITDFIRCRNGTQLGVAQALLARPDVWSLSVVTGPHDLFCQVTVGTAEDLARVLLSDFQHIDGVESTVAETVLRTFKLSYDWARELLGPSAGQIASPPNLHDEQPHVLGPADTAIVAALSADARRPFAAVAEETGIHERTVRSMSVLPICRPPTGWPVSVASGTLP
jgi:DNA-binding Lrp family transcriptional regulator